MFQLNKNNILRGRRNFNEIYFKGRSIINHSIVLLLVDDKRFNGKVGFAAGKKLGGAVVRNRVKRLLREAYRLNKSLLKNNLTMIFIGRKNLVRAKFQSVESSFQDICRRAKILNENKK